MPLANRLFGSLRREAIDRGRPSIACWAAHLWTCEFLAAKWSTRAALTSVRRFQRVPHISSIWSYIVIYATNVRRDTDTSHRPQWYSRTGFQVKSYMGTTVCPLSTPQTMTRLHPTPFPSHFPVPATFTSSHSHPAASKTKLSVNLNSSKFSFLHSGSLMQNMWLYLVECWTIACCTVV